jgi:hypothetical protein
MSATYRAIADALRLGQSPDLSTLAAAGRHELGDAMIAGLEAVETLGAIEPEMREEADCCSLVAEGETVSTPLIWERLRERFLEDGQEHDAVRAALVATGSLAPDDTTTPLPALITALFSL